MATTYTARGFTIYDTFTDGYGNAVRVQQSSNINGGCWVFCQPPDGKESVLGPNGCPIEPSPHLQTIEQVDRLIAALEAAKADFFTVEWVDGVGNE